MRTRRSTPALAGLVLLLLAAGCGTGEGAQDPVELDFILGFVPSGSHAPWYAGVEKGYYAEEGLDVSIQPGESSQTSAAAVAAGAADMGVVDLASVILVKAADPDAPLVAAAPVQAQAPYAIFSLGDGADIREPDDLDGATLYLGTGSSIDRLITAWASRHDVTGFEFARASPGALRELLLSEQVPAILTFVTSRFDLERAAADSGQEIATLALAEWGMDDFYGNVVILNEDYAEEHPEAVRGFLRASRRAWQDALADPQEAAEIMQERFPTLLAEMTRDRLELLRELTSPGGATEPLASFDPAQVASTLDYVHEGIGLDHLPDPEALYTNAYQAP